MRKRALLLSITLFMAVAMSARVYIPLVKSVPPGTAGGGGARIGIRTHSYELLAYYENDSLYIRFPSKTASSVIITDYLTDEVVIDKTFNNESVNVILPMDSLSFYKTYNIYVNAADSWWTGYFDYLPATQIQEKQITLAVGESYKLHVTPDNAKVIWMGEPWKIGTSVIRGKRPSYSYVRTLDPIAVIDDNGLVTALKKGNTVLFLESADGSIREQCQITVCERNINGRTLNQVGLSLTALLALDECEWTDVKFSLSTSGVFQAEGTFYGSSDVNVTNQIVTDQCIFIYFDVHYSDSTDILYPQPFRIQIDGCDAQEYTIYFRNSTGAGNEHESFVRYNITKGSSIDGASYQAGTDMNDAWRDKVYPLNLDFVELPNKMFIKKDPNVSNDYVVSLLDKQFDGNYQIYSWIGDICKIIAEDSWIDNAVTGLIEDDSIVMARRIYAMREEYERYPDDEISGHEDIELCIFNEISYGIKRGYDQNVIDSIANTLGLGNLPNKYAPEMGGIFMVPKKLDFNSLLEMSRILYEKECFTWIEPAFHIMLKNGDDNTTLVKYVHNDNIQPEGRTYYNLSGSKTNNPLGITIVVTRYSDGSIITEKKLFR